MAESAGLPQAIEVEDSGAIEFVTEQATVSVYPSCGMLISSFIDIATGADAIWTTGRPVPRHGGLGVGGSASTDTFMEDFVGGWFPMIPHVGFPDPDDDTVYLHGTAARLPWTITARSSSRLTATVVLENAFTVVRELELTGRMLRVETSLVNAGATSRAVSWGEHPCFDLTTFASGAVTAPVVTAKVPYPALDESAASLASAGHFFWPEAIGVNGAPRVVSAVGDPQWEGHDHIELELLSGSAQLSAPHLGLILDVAWDPSAWPSVLLWRRSKGAANPENVIALEPASVEGRGAADRATLTMMEPGEQWDSWISVCWTDDERVSEGDIHV